MENEVLAKTIRIRSILLPSIIGGTAILYPLLLIGALNGSLTQGGIVVEGVKSIWAPFVMAVIFALFFSVVGSLFLKAGCFLCSFKKPVSIKYKSVIES